jgi:type II secretory pathway component GspD/PulD (secretin)
MKKKRSKIMYCDKNSNDKTKIRKNLFAWSFVLIVAAASAAAGAERSPVEAGTSGSVAVVGITAAETGGSEASVSEDARIPLFNCEADFDVRKALAMLGNMCEKNIVPSQAVAGQLAFRRLVDVTFEEAMDAILGDKFVYEQKGNLVKVYTRDEYKAIKADPDRMIYKVFTLYYITAAEAQSLIEPLRSSSSDAKIQVTSPAEKGTSGGGLASGASGGSSLGSGGSGDTLAMHDTIVVYDYPENIEDIEGLLKTLDIRPKQVLVEATILSALLTEGMELGVDWNLMAGVGLDGTAATGDVAAAGGATDRGAEAITPIEQISTIVNGTPWETSGFANGGPGLRIGVSTGEVRVLITALESITDTTVLANPKIMTVNKQEGSVLIGAELGYRSSTSISTGGVATEGTVEFLETGTTLKFRPYIGNDGYVRMDIYPEDSSGVLNIDGVPTKSTTQLQTNIIVKDGETIVIGGLFRDVVTTTRNQVPLLGDIPLIGALFRGTSDTMQREEVIVLLTTHIIDHPSEVEGVERADDVRRKRFGAKDELQAIGRAKIAEDNYAKAAKCYLDGDVESAMKHLRIALHFRPGYLEAIRLKERIIAETDPSEAKKLERIMQEAIDEKEASKWSRK